MLGLIISHAQPIADKGRVKQRAEAQRDIEGEVDRVQLNMRQRMQQGKAALRPPRNRALRHHCWGDKDRAISPSRVQGRQGRLCFADGKGRAAQGADSAALFVRVFTVQAKENLTAKGSRITDVISFVQ